MKNPVHPYHLDQPIVFTQLLLRTVVEGDMVVEATVTAEGDMVEEEEDMEAMGKF